MSDSIKKSKDSDKKVKTVKSSSKPTPGICDQDSCLAEANGKKKKRNSRHPGYGRPTQHCGDYQSVKGQVDSINSSESESEKAHLTTVTVTTAEQDQGAKMGNPLSTQSEKGKPSSDDLGLRGNQPQSRLYPEGERAEQYSSSAGSSCNAMSTSVDAPTLPDNIKDMDEVETFIRKILGPRDERIRELLASEKTTLQGHLDLSRKRPLEPSQPDQNEHYGLYSEKKNRGESSVSHNGQSQSTHLSTSSQEYKKMPSAEDVVAYVRNILFKRDELIQRLERNKAQTQPTTSHEHSKGGSGGRRSNNGTRSGQFDQHRSRDKIAEEEVSGEGHKRGDSTPNVQEPEQVLPSDIRRIDEVVDDVRRMLSPGYLLIQNLQEENRALEKKDQELQNQVERLEKKNAEQLKQENELTRVRQEEKAAFKDNLEQKEQDNKQLQNQVDILKRENAELLKWRNDQHTSFSWRPSIFSSGSATKKQVKCLLAQRKTDSEDFSRANQNFWKLVKKQLDHQLVIVDEVITDPTRLGIQEPGTVLIVPCLNSSRLVTDVEGVVKHWSLGQQQVGKPVALVIFHHQAESHRLGVTASNSVLPKRAYIQEMVDVMFWRGQGVYSSDQNKQAAYQMASFVINAQ